MQEYFLFFTFSFFLSFFLFHFQQAILGITSFFSQSFPPFLLPSSHHLFSNQRKLQYYFPPHTSQSKRSPGVPGVASVEEEDESEGEAEKPKPRFQPKLSPQEEAGCAHLTILLFLLFFFEPYIIDIKFWSILEVFVLSLSVNFCIWLSKFTHPLFPRRKSGKGSVGLDRAPHKGPKNAANKDRDGRSLWLEGTLIWFYFTSIKLKEIFHTIQQNTHTLTQHFHKSFAN